MDQENQLDRLLKVSMQFLDNYTKNETKESIMDLFPDNWDIETINYVLNELLTYCSEREYWEQSVILRDAKEKINS
jgi:hypothetical protein